MRKYVMWAVLAAVFAVSPQVTSAVTKPVAKKNTVKKTGTTKSRTTPTAIAVASRPAPLLPVDCSANPNDARCKMPGRDNPIGKGIPLYQGGLYDTILGGDLKNGVLYAAIEYGARDAGTDPNTGAVVAIDVKSGDRTLISGGDNQGERKGSGMGLNGIRDVKVMEDGNLIAVVDVSSLSPLYLVKIDRATGNRSVLWSHKPSVPFSPIRGNGSALASDAGPVSAKFAKPDNRIGYRDGTVYFTVSNNPDGTGWGLWKLNLSTLKAGMVSGYWKTGENRAGSGIGIAQTAGNLRGVFLDGDKAYFNSFPNDALIEVDLNTGARRLVSSKARMKGAPGNYEVGDGSVLRFGDKFFISDPGVTRSYASVQVIDPTSGDRSALAFKKGPADSNATHDDQPMWTDGKVLYMPLGRALIGIDPTTGNSNIISQ